MIEYEYGTEEEVTGKCSVIANDCADGRRWIGYAPMGEVVQAYPCSTSSEASIGYEIGWKMENKGPSCLMNMSKRYPVKANRGLCQ